MATVNIGGAGIAGQIAAHTICILADRDKRDYPEINIFEAHPLPGGRAKIQELHGTVVDNRWCHRGRENKLFQFLRENYNLLDSQAGVQGRRESFFDDRVEKSAILKAPHRLGLSLRRAALEVLQHEFRKLEDRQPFNFGKPLDIPLFDLAHRTKSPFVIDEMEWLCTWTGLDPRQVSYREIAEDPAGSGGLLFRDGVPLWLLRDDLGRRGVNYYFGTTITKISRLGDHCVLRDHRGEDHKADETIVTFSPGVLKYDLAHGDNLFSPGPPPGLVECLDDIDMANMTKATVAWLKLEMEGRIYFHVNRIKGFFDAHPGFSPTFCIGGPSAVEVERMGDDARAELITRVLWDSGKYRGPGLSPDQIHSTKYNGDRLTQGAYSILRPGGVRYQPIRDEKARLTVGGEYTAASKDSAGTMEAAVVAGREMGHTAYWRIAAQLPVRSGKREPIASKMPGQKNVYMFPGGGMAARGSKHYNS